MSKRQTKADQILHDARRRVERAQAEVRDKGAALRAAEAALEAHLDSLAALENALAPKPRKKTAKPQTAQEPLALVPPDAPEDKGPLCGICGNTEDYQDHFKPSPNYHEFEQPKVKKVVGR